MIAVVAVLLSQGGPLVGVPSSWIHVGKCSYDRTAGAYFDETSGVYIKYSITPSVSADDDGEWPEGGTLPDGTRFRLRARSGGARIVREELAKSMGLPADELPGEVERRIVPPADSDLLEVRFDREGHTWRFQSASCSREQAERARAFILDPQLRFSSPTATTSGSCSSRTLELAAVEAAEKKSLPEVLASLGVPESSWQPRCGAVVVQYALTLRGSRRGYQALFERDLKHGPSSYIEGPFGRLEGQRRP
jgi:hypothetical protein